nr:hypothetical protein [Methylobacterium nonmethylotrophicum]
MSAPSGPATAVTSILDEGVRPRQRRDDNDSDGGGPVGGPAHPAYLPKRGTIVGPRQEECRLGDVGPSEAGRGEQRLDIVHRLPELVCERRVHPAVRRDAEMARDEKGAAGRDLAGVSVDRAELLRHGPDSRRFDGL